jgi:hypothetical protein
MARFVVGSSLADDRVFLLATFADAAFDKRKPYKNTTALRER